MDMQDQDPYDIEREEVLRYVECIRENHTGKKFFKDIEKYTETGVYGGKYFKGKVLEKIYHSFFYDFFRSGDDDFMFAAYFNDLIDKNEILELMKKHCTTNKRSRSRSSDRSSDRSDRSSARSTNKKQRPRSRSRSHDDLMDISDLMGNLNM
jgi:hypothetical protein